MPTEVTLRLKGSLVLFAKEGRPTGSVRILKDPPPNHVLTLNYQVRPPGGSLGQPVPVTPIQDALLIDVQNPTNPNISHEDKGAVIKRMEAPTSQSSFNWLVDLENPQELYDYQIGVKKSAFKQVLTFNSGHISASELSYNFLHCQVGINEIYKPFGFVAVRIDIKFSTDDKVIFKNGGAVVFDTSQAASGTAYRINLDNDTSTHPSIVTDANHYYKAVGAGIPQEERILFASVKEDEAFQLMLKQASLSGDSARVAELKKLQLDPPAGPEAACFPAFLGQSEP